MIFGLFDYSPEMLIPRVHGRHIREHPSNDSGDPEAGKSAIMVDP
jgi:hypothetical protein